jgi:hypothetical protein
MSRSGYSDDLDPWALIRWRGAVNAAIRGERGQRLLRELAAAMDAMPEKVLIADDLVDAEGDHCALGVVGKARGIDLAAVDPEDAEAVGNTFDIAYALAKEVVYINDEGHYGETPQQRWARVRAWVQRNVANDPALGADQGEQP